MSPCSLRRREACEARQGYRTIEQAFDGFCCTPTRFVLVPGSQARHLGCVLITVAATVVLYIEIPKGFFPQQDTGIISGLSDAPQDIAFTEMCAGSTHCGFVAKDPDIEATATGLGGSRRSTMFRRHRPEAARQAQRQRDRSPTACGSNWSKCPARHVHAGGQDSCRRPSSRTQYQYTVKIGYQRAQ